MTDDLYEIPSKTPDLQTELARKLQELVPEAMADGKIDVAKLTELLAGDAADSNERFGLFWPGKKRALRAAQEPTTATLCPDKVNSKNWDTTKNIFIEGDNLEVLKVLQKHYHGKINMIYIDPPYNTGQDFVYPDNFKEGLDTYLEWSKQVNEEGKRVSTNSEAEGRFHTNWLNMMYPRLKLARNLLANDGTVFISIDGNEVENLLRLGKEIFGEHCYLGTLCWLKKRKGSFLSKGIVSTHEYVLAFGRRPGVRLFGGKADASESQPLVKRTNPVSVLRFPAGVETRLQDSSYRPGTHGTGSSAVDLLTPIEIKGGVVESKFELKGRFIWSQAYLDDQLARGARIVMNTEKFQPRAFKAPSESDFKGLSSVLNGVTMAATNEDAYEYAVEIFGTEGVLEYPKPVNLIKALIQSATAFDKDALVLDFFAGSGTTGDAVVRLNAEDGGKRRYILVQLPEPTAETSAARGAGFSTISELSQFRLQAAGEKVVSEQRDALFERESPLDCGYRVYRLVDTNFSKWRVASDIEVDKLAQHLLDLRDSARENATIDALQTELLLKQGYSLTEKDSDENIAGLTLRSVGGGLLLAYLDKQAKPQLDQLREVIEQKPARFIILEDALHGDDQLKTNLAQLCKSKGVELWTA